MTKTRTVVAWLTLAVAILTSIAAAVGVYGYRAGWWGLISGRTIATVAIAVGLAAGLVALIAIVFPPYRKPLLPRLAAAAAVVVSVVAAIPGAIEYRTPLAAARIHDISSDVGNPPVFMDLVAVRGEVTNPPDYPGTEFARAQQQWYPDIKPVRLDVPPEQAFVKVRALVQDLGWQIVADVPDQGRIEAVATTRWFGVKDDVVIRVSWIDKGSRVDIRSKSRIARNDYGGDHGENARRVQAFLKRLSG